MQLYCTYKLLALVLTRLNFPLQATGYWMRHEHDGLTHNGKGKQCKQQHKNYIASIQHFTAEGEVNFK